MEMCGCLRDRLGGRTRGTSKVAAVFIYVILFFGQAYLSKDPMVVL